jgi:sugar phosphate isomerase/epimerase
MYFGYNTNGFAHHRLEDALTILADLGYQSVAITLDYNALNPYDSGYPKQMRRVRDILERRRLRSVIETGARFLLEAERKHQPTLISPDSLGRETRLGFLMEAVEIARGLDSDAVSFWSGTPTDDAPTEILMDRLVDGCRQLCDYAAERNMRLAFEPEPGMFIDTMARWTELDERIPHPLLGLTIDIGHLHCQGETPIANQIQQWRHRLRNVHLADMRRGVHDHLMFGEGEIEFGPVLRTLEEIGYAGGVHVELSRHSHDAVNTARRTLEFLRNL